ncbi:condensation domain-containing protein, partial [Aquibium sp. ELW1220]|uniref:condensation domain-containing protein n=1 Tax=Aquibium sp. ELW1220 TaxID=2976766 RepID=UPI0025B031E2
MGDHYTAARAVGEGFGTPGALPLSPAQLGIYFAHLRDPRGNRFNLAQVTTIDGDVDIALFRQAAADVVAATPALQMVIVASQGEPQQVAVDRGPVEVPFHDLREVADPAAAHAVICSRMVHCPFDLERGPLFRWALIKSREGQTDWVQVSHHIIADGWSGQRLIGKVASRYGQIVSDGSRCEPLATELYAAHLEEEIAYQEGDTSSRDRTYWHALLADADLAAPFEERGSEADEAHFARHRIVIRAGDLQAVNGLAETHGVTPGQVVIAAVAILEAVRQGRNDVVVGTPLLGRFGSAARAVVSMSSNVGHLRLRDIWNQSTRSLLAVIRGQQLANLRRQRFRYEILRKEIVGAHSDAPLTRVHVNQMAFDYDIPFGNLRSETRNLSNGPVDGLSLAIYPQMEEQLVIDLNGATENFDSAGLRRVAEQLLHVLKQFSDCGGETPLASLSLTPPSDVALLSGFNATEREVAG